MTSRMNEMLGMLDRMAIWAKHFKIAESIILAISVLVVNPQDSQIFRISAPTAGFDHPAPSHCSKGRPGCLGIESRECRFVDACFRAIDSIVGWRIHKSLPAASAYVFDGSLAIERLVVAATRAVFGSFLATGDYLKFAPTQLAYNRHLIMLVMPSPSALPRTESKFIPAVFRHMDRSSALSAWNEFESSAFDFPAT